MAPFQHPDKHEKVPPPIPLRNPRRVDDLDVYKGRSPVPSLPDCRSTQPSPSVTQTIIEEVDGELDDTQERLVSTTSNEDGGVSLWQRDNVRGIAFGSVKPRGSEVKETSPLWGDAENTSRASTSSSLTNGLQRYSAYLGSGQLPSIRRREEKVARQREIEDAMAKMRTHDGPDSFTIFPSHDGTSDRVTVAGEDARVEAWLHRGTFAVPTLEVDRVSQASKTASRVSEQQRASRSIVTSPSSTRRNFASPVSPLSPMDNGRDAYGNFIPTNTQDYITAQSPPKSPPLRTSMESINQPNIQPSPTLRGGGGWWNNLTMGQGGKESSVRIKPSSVKSGNGHSGIPASISRGNNLMGAQAGVPHAGATSATVGGSAKGRPSIATEREWSDEESVLEERRRSMLLQQNTNDQTERDRNKYTDRFAASTVFCAVAGPSSPASSKHPKLPSGRPQTPKIFLSASTKGGFRSRGTVPWSPRRLSSDEREQLESSPSGVSYNTRTDKRWNNPPSTVPSGRALPPPPPPLPKDSGSPRPQASYETPMPERQHPYLPSDVGEGRQQPIRTNLHLPRPPSPAGSSDDGIDLQSLGFGESVSAAGGPWRGRQFPVGHSPVQPFNAEEYHAQQLVAQAQFRGLCEDVMTHFNEEISRLRGEVQMGRMTQEQFEGHSEYLTRNKDHALRHCAETSQYVLLSNEHAVLEAMKTANGYAIYKHIYQTTQPSTWQSLVAKHSRTTNPTATTSPTRPRTPSSASSSSFDRARHATGKIARFILAVPSDPAYKTHSNRAPDINPRQFAAAMPWLNPMAVEAFAGADTWIPQNKRDKGKGREVARLGAEGVEEMDFAPATAAAAHVPPTSPERTLDAPPALPRESEVSGGSAWPESDSQGNWYDAGKARLRGGGLVRRRTGAKGKGKKVLELGAEKEGLM